MDRFISDQLDTVSRTMIQNHIRSGAVVVNGKQVKSNYLLVLNDRINIALKTRKERELDVLPETMDLNIIHEDDSIIVINKPAGLVVHPGIGNESGTLVNGLIDQFSQLSNVNGTIRKGIVHRLDADTSGIIIIAKTNDSHSHLANQFKNRTIKKEYRALTWGVWDEVSGKIDQNIKRSRSDPRIYCVDQNGKNSITNYLILEQYRYYSYVAFMPMTGRTHQIRVHAAWSGHPIFGDEKYGGGMNKCKGFLSDIRKHLFEVMTIFGHQALHAYKLECKHPKTDQQINFTAPLPDTFVNLIESIND
ncbi:uncharacterized protein METZ01_LOCUS130156 [marine metagenome]|uniref:Pseudouridine synthase RsuA/RluA-like domain-containing protein n=1 Tax=marine metagenome TaxID=408172 RepID=A0A381YL27_9ZZZZ